MTGSHCHERCRDNVLAEKQIRTNGQCWNKFSACGVFNHSSSYGNFNLQYFELDSVFVDGQIRCKRDWSPSRQTDLFQTPNYGGHGSQNIRKLKYSSNLSSANNECNELDDSNVDENHLMCVVNESNGNVVIDSGNGELNVGGSERSVGEFST